MKETLVKFKSEKLTLEGLLALPGASGPARAAVVCHPHPQYGGSMYNNVVEAVLDALWSLRVATLRFNFRGVGQSEGAFAGGVGEAEDAAAALRFLLDQPNVGQSHAVVAGYSFGAVVGLRAGCGIDQVATLIAVAPPIAMADLSFLCNSDKRVLLLAGDRDPYCPLAQLDALQQKLAASHALRFIAGADHFFAGFEEALADAIRSLLQAPLEAPG